MFDNLNRVYVRNNRIETAAMKDELGMINVDTGKYFMLDPIASSIWNALETPMTMERLVKHLMNVYDVNEETCMEETKVFIRELIEYKLVKPLEPQT